MGKRKAAEAVAEGGAAAAASADAAPASLHLVLVLGGQQRLGQGPLASALLSSPQGWLSISLSRERTGLGAVVAADGTAYLVGGAGKGSESRLDSVEALRLPARADNSPASTQLPKLAAPRLFPGVALCGNELWVVGGCNGKRVERSCERFLLSSPSTSWKAGASLPAVRFGNTLASTTAGLLVAAGGLNSSRACVASVETLDTTADTAAWTAAPSLRQARAYAACAVPTSGPLAGRVVIAGGVGLGSTTAARLVTEAWMPSSSAWVAIAPALLTPRQGHVMWAEPDGTLVVAGGRDSKGAYLSSME